MGRGGDRWAMWRTVLVYGLALAAGTVVLNLIQFRLMAREHPGEVYLFLLAIGFMALGIWVGLRLARRPAQAGFEQNTRVVQTLGISDREFEVLELLAAGQSNKEISARLSVSPNTVKTHVARLFEKLEVSRRTAAIQKARELGMIP
jgi:DNA-binding CsgD family transcriptional regulator